MKHAWNKRIAHIKDDVFDVDGSLHYLNAIDIFKIDSEEDAVTMLELLRQYRWSEPPKSTPDLWPLLEAKIGRLQRRIRSRWPTPELVHINTLKHVINREDGFVTMLESLAKKVLDCDNTPDDLKKVARGHLRAIKNTKRDADIKAAL